MNNVHEIATLTSKGQITLPKAIRGLLGVESGSKLAFKLRGGEVIVSRAEAEHEDPAITAFLTLLAADIGNGSMVSDLPAQLAAAMLENAALHAVADDSIDGDVSI